MVSIIAVLELCRLHIRFIFEIVIVLPLDQKFHNYFLRYLPLCCLAFFILSLFSFQGANSSPGESPDGGDKRNRTADPLLAKQVLYQLSYTPV